MFEIHRIVQKITVTFSEKFAGGSMLVVIAHTCSVMCCHIELDTRWLPRSHMPCTNKSTDTRLKSTLSVCSCYLCEISHGVTSLGHPHASPRNCVGLPNQMIEHSKRQNPVINLRIPPASTTSNILSTWFKRVQSNHAQEEQKKTVAWYAPVN